jgi:hypothetical protein
MRNIFNRLHVPFKERGGREKFFDSLVEFGGFIVIIVFIIVMVFYSPKFLPKVKTDQKGIDAIFSVIAPDWQE